MGLRLLEEADSACRLGGIGTPARFILLQLANRAQDATRLAWPAHPDLSAVTGLSSRSVANAVAELERADRISIWRRSGKVPLYLVHPHGRNALLPPVHSDMLKHLSAGRFTRAEKEAAWEWLASLMNCGESMNSRADPRTRFGGPSHGETDTLAPLARDARTTFGGAPEPRSTEPESNPKITRTPALAIVEGSKTDRSKGRPAKVDASRFRGAPRQVLERLLAAGGKEAEQLGALTEPAALAQIEKTQRLLRIVR